jgi:hypothetical protein
MSAPSSEHLSNRKKKERNRRVQFLSRFDGRIEDGKALGGKQGANLEGESTTVGPSPGRCNKQPRCGDSRTARGKRGKRVQRGLSNLHASALRSSIVATLRTKS